MTKRIKLKYPSDAGELIVDYLNNNYKVEVAIGEELEAEENWVPAEFIWREYDGISGDVIIYTNWYNIGQCWQKRLDFSYTNIDYKCSISNKEIKEYVENIIDEITTKFGEYITITERR